MFFEKITQNLSLIVESVKKTPSLFNLDGENGHNLIGIEIDSDFIKFLKLQKIGTRYTVENFDIIALPPGTVVKEVIKDSYKVANLLRLGLERTGIKTRNIAISIPRSSAIVKNTTVDKRLKGEEIESRVWIEANRLFPNLISDIYLDFILVGSSEQDPGQNEIILVACRKEQIDPMIAVMDLADLDTKIVDVNSYALERALLIIAEENPSLKTLALLNIGVSLITLIVLYEGQLIYTHELTYDGYNLGKQGENDVLDIQKTSEDLKSNLSLHLRHTMQFFYSSRPTIRIDQIILGGDLAATIPNLAQFVKEETGKETALANPFKKMSLSARVDATKLERFAPALMLCCGLALSQLDLKYNQE